MTKKEALEELRSAIRLADFVNETYVDCILKEAAEIAAKALEQHIERDNSD